MQSNKHCVFIALHFGLLYQAYSFPRLSGQFLNEQWQTALQDAIRIGNDIHDELFDGQGIDVTAEEATSAVGEQCRACGVLQEYNIFRANPVDQLEDVTQSLLQVKPSFNIFVLNAKAVLLIVDCGGNLIFVDSHRQGCHGALIARSVPHSGRQAQWFSMWFNQILEIHMV